MEHFVTLFDRNFAAQGLALLGSLKRRCRTPFKLWVVAMDGVTIEILERFAAPELAIIPLNEIETYELIAAKSSRSIGEYCWTITPFTFSAVFAREPSCSMVTYLDADLFFFDDPQVLLKEFRSSDCHVYITEHAYDPRHDQSQTSGRFCVQFLAARNSPQGNEVLRWWQERCVEWCFARFEDGKFGDQKYLDAWPTLFSNTVAICDLQHRTLAPWNVMYFGNIRPLDPVFFHFHTFRIIDGRMRLFHGYGIRGEALELYAEYAREVSRTWNWIQKSKFDVKMPQSVKEPLAILRKIKRWVLSTERFAKIQS